MAQKTKNTKPPNRSPAKNEHEKDTLWYLHGVEDVYFQREAQVNFWTVLGGIAIAALLTQVASLNVEIQAGRWYLVLYVFTAIMLIATSWVQNLWGSLILKIQVNYLYVLLWLMNMLSLSVMCLYVTKPAVFLAGCAAFIMFTLFFQMYLAKSGAWDIFPSPMQKGIKKNLWLYFAILLVCSGAVIHLSLYPSKIAEIGWGIFALLSSISAIVMHNFAMKKERKEFGVP